MADDPNSTADAASSAGDAGGTCSPDDLDAAGQDANAANACDVGATAPVCAAQKPPVTPIVRVQQPIVLVKRTYTTPKRQPVVLTVDDGGFDGSGSIDISSAAINFYDAATGGNIIGNATTFTSGQLVPGVTMYGEGVSPSAAMDDVVITLTLTAGSQPVNPPAKGTMTSVRVTLDICPSRTVKGTDPLPLSPGDKINVGRPLRVQKNNTAHRGMMIVRKAEPAVFPGNLVVNPLDAKVNVFGAADEVPSGQATLGRHTIPNGTIDAAKGMVRWAEGNSVSGALHDTGFQLGVDGIDDDGDRVAITAFTVDKIECQLLTTPCKRGGTPPGTMQSTNSTKDDRTFASGYTAVIRNCGDLAMIATATPAVVTLTWGIERASDDTGLAGLPTDSAGADDKHHTVKTDAATGSFNVMAFVDANGSGKRDPENDGGTFNLVIVEMTVPAGAANNTIITNPNYHLKPDPRFPNVMIVQSANSNGQWSHALKGAVYGDAEFANHLINMKVTVKLTGGGANQKRGTEKITLGYVQQTTADSVTGTYADGKTLKEAIFASPLPASPVTAGTPALLAFPVRDTRGATAVGTDAFIISSSDADTSDFPGGGFQKIVRFIDPPAIALDLTHPVSGSALASIAGSNDFQDFLAGFSSDFNENFTVLASATWSATYGSFSPPTVPPAPPGGGWSNVGAAVTPSGATMFVNSPAVPGSTVNMERCAPNFVDNLVMDAR